MKTYMCNVSTHVYVQVCAYVFPVHLCNYVRVHAHNYIETCLLYTQLCSHEYELQIMNE